MCSVQIKRVSSGFKDIEAGYFSRKLQTTFRKFILILTLFTTFDISVSNTLYFEGVVHQL